MKFKKLMLQAIPIIQFSHGYQTKSNTWDLSVNPNLIEITFIEQGDLIRVDTERHEQNYSASSIICCFHDKAYRMQTMVPIHQHFTFAFCTAQEPTYVTAEEILKSRLDTLEKKNNASIMAILPECISAGTTCDKIAKNIKQIVTAHSSFNYASNLTCTKLLFDVLTGLTQFSLEAAQRECGDCAINFTNQYCKKAIEYISAHVEQKIYVQDIAKKLKISYGYLSRIMYDNMGMTLIDYVNRIKLEHVKELLLAKNITLEEAGRCVGISDVKYLSRIFKKYNGITAKEYKKLHNSYTF